MPRFQNGRQKRGNSQLLDGMAYIYGDRRDAEELATELEAAGEATSTRGGASGTAASISKGSSTPTPVRSKTCVHKMLINDVTWMKFCKKKDKMPLLMRHKTCHDGKIIVPARCQISCNGQIFAALSCHRRCLSYRHNRRRWKMKILRNA